MKRALYFALVLVLLTNAALPVLAATAWPSTTYTEIGSGVRAELSSVEPSGLAWDSDLNQLLMVSDEGQLLAFDADGSNVQMVTVGGDLEGVVRVGDYIYVADEDGKIAQLEVDFDLGTVTTVQSWDMTPWVPELTCPGGSGGCGAEGLTYAEGYFYAGYQYNGKIYQFDLSGSTPVKVGELDGLSGSGYWDISELSYRDGYLYALYSDTLAIMSLDGTIETTYSGIVGSDEEGLALGPDSDANGDANIYIAEDVPQTIYSYDDFPIYGWAATVDSDVDDDGVEASLDCDDTDPTVSSLQTYYVDADGDTDGSTSSATFCSSVVPTGYANNAVDYNDTIPSHGVENGSDGVDNDGDGKVDEVNLLAENGMHPYYSTLDPDASTTSTIKKVWGLTRGSFAVRFKDGSRYRYYVVSSKTTEVSTVSMVSGTAYANVTVGGVTYTVNVYTGELVY